MNTNHTSIRFRFVAAAGALALLLAACGDSGDATTTTGPPETEATTTTTTEPGVTTTTDGATTTTRAPRSTTGTTGGDTTTTTDEGGGTTTTTAARTTTTALTDDALAAALAVRESPLEIELDDGTLITFSEWFFATFNRDATVKVERGGNVLTEGTVVDTAVMEDRGVDGFAFFDAGGNLVAQLSQMELLDAANQALIDAGLAP